MTDYDLGKAPEAKRGFGWGTATLVLLGGVTLGGLLANVPGAKPAPKPVAVAADTMRYSVGEICSGSAVVRLRQVDVSPKPPEPDEEDRATYVLAQPVGTQYIVSCHRAGDYRDYLRVGQLARLSMVAG